MTMQASSGKHFCNVKATMNSVCIVVLRENFNNIKAIIVA
jgi:hypothetical protein